MSLLPPLPPSPAPIRILGRLIDWVVVAMGAAIVVVVFINVVMHQLDRDIAWTTEFGEFIMVWATFLGAAAATRRGGHMAITEFIDLARGRLRLALDLAIQSLVILALVLLVWYGWGCVMANWGNVLTVLDWPMAWQYLALPLGAACSLVFVVYDAVQMIQGKSRAERYGE
jgi:TRAP-type C4-dicarboxylate transport system permease small subunit